MASTTFCKIACRCCFHLLFIILTTILQGKAAFGQSGNSIAMDSMGNSPQERGLIAEVLGPDLSLELEENHSKLVRTKQPVLRSSIIDPQVIEITQFDATNLEIIGLKEGSTDISLWFGNPSQPGDGTVLRYRVRVKPSSDAKEQQQIEYSELESKINELFPNSSIELILIEGRVVVRGQARDSEEAAKIMALVRRSYRGTNPNSINGSTQAFNTTVGSNAGSLGTRVIDMLRVPGEQQVLLKVRIAEISRSALRELGLDFSVDNDNLNISSTFGNAGNVFALLKGEEVTLMLRALSSNAYSKILAEPNLVTLSGRTASFIAGGQFAVPTAVGIGGIGAATTAFQGFGTQVQFTPTVMDKDRIRLQVAPTFSSINSENSVNGIPGLNTRSVHTTVDMREGQWLAVAGLIEDQLQGSKARIPGLGDLPIGGALFGNNMTQRNETELLILVSPQLVHPLDAEAIPSILPGMDVSEPDNHEFFIENQIESTNSIEFRSTVWPTEQSRARRNSQNMKCGQRYREKQSYYIQSDFGFSK